MKSTTKAKKRKNIGKIKTNSRINPPFSSLFVLFFSVFLTNCQTPHEPSLISEKSRLQIAEKAFNRKEYALAKKIWKEILIEKPNNNTIREKLSELYLIIKNPKKVLVITAHSGSVLLKRIRGIAFDVLGKHEEAQKIYNEILKTSMDDRATFNNLILSYFLSGQVEKAEKMMEEFSFEKTLIVSPFESKEVNHEK